MTLKEKVAEVEPSKASNEFFGGINGCPSEFGFLNSDDFLGNCPWNETDSVMTCTECWNREFISSEEKPQEPPSSETTSRESKLHKIAKHLDSKSYFSLEFSNDKWYIECWTDCKLRMIHNGFVDDLDKGLDDVIEKLGGGSTHE